MTITIQTEGRRHYLVGNTYPIKDALRSAGCTWDRDRGAWWTGKLDVAEGFVAKVASGSLVGAARWVKLPTGFGVLVADTAVQVGATVPVQSREGGTRDVQLAALIETREDGSRVFAPVPREKSSSGTSYRRGGGRRAGWRPCGYPGCNPSYCDECDGEGYRHGR